MCVSIQKKNHVYVYLITLALSSAGGGCGPCTIDLDRNANNRDVHLSLHLFGGFLLLQSINFNCMPVSGSQLWERAHLPIQET